MAVPLSDLVIAIPKSWDPGQFLNHEIPGLENGLGIAVPNHTELIASIVQ